MMSLQTADGHGYFGDILPFGETVLFRIPGPRHRGQGPASKVYRADERRGIWLGKTEDSNEHVVGCDGGVYRVLEVRRLPPPQRGDRAVLESIIGLPWDTKVTAPVIVPGRLSLSPLPADPEVLFQVASSALPDTRGASQLAAASSSLVGDATPPCATSSSSASSPTPRSQREPSEEQPLDDGARMESRGMKRAPAAVQLGDNARCECPATRPLRPGP